MEPALKSFERYDIENNYWEKLPDCNMPSVRCLLVSLNDKFIFKFGGVQGNGSPCTVIERYNVATNQWNIVEYVIKEDSQKLKTQAFNFFPGMGGVQISFNSILVSSTKL